MHAARQKIRKKSGSIAASGQRRAGESTLSNQSTRASNSHRLGSFYASGPVVSIGNVQAKFTIGKANDPYEREADAVADHVVSGKQAPPITPVPAAGLNSVAKMEHDTEEPEKNRLQTQLIQRQPEEEAEEEEPPQTQLVQRQTQENETEEEPAQIQLIQRQPEEEPEEEAPQQTQLIQRQTEENETEEEPPQTQLIQRQPEEALQSKAIANRSPTVTAGLQHQIQSLKGAGQALPGSERSFFESRFGTDFSHVRVHNDAGAAHMAGSINARAFARGHDLVFGSGQYAQGTSSGRRLLAHELTHVVQQNHGSVKPVSAPLTSVAQRLANTEQADKNLPQTQRIQRAADGDRDNAQPTLIQRLCPECKDEMDGTQASGIQTKLTVTSADNPDEDEADDIAERAANMPGEEETPQSMLLQREVEEPEQEEPPQPQLIQRQADDNETEQEPSQTQGIQRQPEDIPEGETPPQPKLIQRLCPGCKDEMEPGQESAVQAKLTIGLPGDEYENQADAVSDKVMRMKSSSPSPGAFDEDREVIPDQTDLVQQKPITSKHIQRLCPACEDESEQHDAAGADNAYVQSKANNFLSPSSAVVAKTIQSSTGGSPPPEHVQSRVGQVLGSKLDHVRVHSDAQANTAAESINAKAFTHQNHVYLGKGQSADDVQLMAHELTHVLQQGHGVGADINPKRHHTVFRKQASVTPTTVTTNTPDIQCGFWGDVWEDISSGASAAWEGVSSGASAVWEGAKSIGRAIGRTASAALGWITDVGSAIGLGAAAAWRWVQSVASSIGLGVLAAWDWVKNVASTIGSGLLATWEFIKSIGHAIGRGILSAWDWTREVASTIGRGLLAAWESLKEMARFIGRAILSAWEWIKEAAVAIGRAILQAWEFIKEVARAIGRAILAAWEWIKEAAVAIGRAILEAWEFAKEVARAIGRAILDAWEWIKETAAAIGRAILEAWEFIKEVARAIGRAIVRAWEWIKELAQTVGRAILAAWEWIKYVAHMVKKGILKAWEWIKAVARALGLAIWTFWACFGPKLPFCLINFFQTKSRDAKHGDIYEQEADRVADTVVNMNTTSKSRVNQHAIQHKQGLAVSKKAAANPGIRPAVSVSQTTNNNVIQRYSKDIHLEMTYKEAKNQAGFSSTDADIIAEEDNAVDSGMRHPWVRFAIETLDQSISDKDLLHFPARSVAEGDVKGAISKCDIRTFGAGLHRFQDSYSHNFTTWSTPPWRICASCCWLLGAHKAAPILLPNPAYGRKATHKHLCLFTYPDQHNSEQLARDNEMQLQTRFWLQEFMSNCPSFKPKLAPGGGGIGGVAEAEAVNVEVVSKAVDEIVDALEGYTSRWDSERILNQFSSNPDAANAILTAYKSRTNDTKLEWLFGDMTAEDRDMLRDLLISLGVSDLRSIIVQELMDRLQGYTSEDDSREILSRMQKYSGGEMDGLLAALETRAATPPTAMSDWLFGDLDRVAAENLRTHLLASNSLKAEEYALSWTVSKIDSLLTGYTSRADSAAILRHFRVVEQSSQRSKLQEKLEAVTQRDWSQTAENALMEDVREGDYRELSRLAGLKLRQYDYKKPWYESLTEAAEWRLIILEWLACGLAGVVTGLLSVLGDFVEAIWSVLKGISNLLWSAVYLLSGGAAGSENWYSVKKFFIGIGEAFSDPAAIFENYWKDLKLEYAIIEGILSDCRRAEFVVRKFINGLVNLILIFAAGYGAVRGGIKALTRLARGIFKGKAPKIKAPKLEAPTPTRGGGELPPSGPTRIPPSHQLPPGEPTRIPPSRQLPPGKQTRVPPRRQLPAVSASTEQMAGQLIADSNPKFLLSRNNAIDALRGPAGATVEVAGPGGAGPDVVFRLGSRVLRREIKCIAGGAQGSFNREIAHAAKQIRYGGEILVQTPVGTDGLRLVLRFRGSRRSAAELGKYRSVKIKIVDSSGTVQYEGMLVP